MLVCAAAWDDEVGAEDPDPELLEVPVALEPTDVVVRGPLASSVPQCSLMLFVQPVWPSWLWVFWVMQSLKACSQMKLGMLAV